MNIVVKTYGGGICCRPDTTWERENKDFYSPDFIDSYLFTPVLFARISKAGRCVAGKFASRYYDSIGYGMMLYPGNLMKSAQDGTPSGFAWASCIDHTSVLPFPMYNRITLESKENIFRISKDGDEIYSTSEGSAQLVENAIEEATKYISIRIGDIIAIELDTPKELIPADAHGKKIELSGEFCGNETFRYKVIM